MKIINNPILLKDMKTKLRGWRTPVLISCYVLLLTGILLLFFLGNNMLDRYSTSAFDPRLAVDAYNYIIVFQFALLFLIVPAMTATSISGERERQTLKLMLVTQTPTHDIIIGKILISVAHSILLLLSSMPVLGMVFFFGGIGIMEIVKLLIFYVLTSFFVASSGVFFSTLFRKSIVAIISTYIFLGLLTFGTFFVLGFRAIIMEYVTHSSIDVTYATYLTSLFPSPVFGFTSFYFDKGDYYSFRYSLWGELASEINSQIAYETSILRFLKPWIANGLFDILASALLIFMSSIMLSPLIRKK